MDDVSVTIVTVKIQQKPYVDISDTQNVLILIKKLKTPLFPETNGDWILTLKLYLLELGENVCWLRHLVSVSAAWQYHTTQGVAKEIMDNRMKSRSQNKGMGKNDG